MERSLCRTVLIADDDEGVRTYLTQFLAQNRYEPIVAADGREAYEMALAQHPDLILLDVQMPGLDGIEVCRRLKRRSGERYTPIVLVTSLVDLGSRVAGIAAGADDFFSKPFEATELLARIRSLLTLKSAIDELEHAEAVITSLELCVEARDPYTGGHCERLSHYAVDLGKRVGLTERELRTVRLGGLLHDLGKIAVPDNILLKPGPLTDDEWLVIRRHPGRGKDLCDPLKSFGEIALIIRHHHEKWNGSGYPDGLKGEGIPINARIVGIVDAFDALRTRRSYKPSFPLEETMRILRDETEKGLWDPDLMNHFTTMTSALPGATDGI
ncbi:MAG: hypothetical protein A2Z34_05740 [Planctomycetes bacterium RBG_16_59_8]|nr:MAG: hypothetical protein A2Z34_05740 [Planctomycetes bacterium RBG_16_59_8]